MVKLEDLKIKTTVGIWGLAAYDHRTGEILMPPWWKKTPFYLVSLAHEVGHMLHHQEVGTEEYLKAKLLNAEDEAWVRGIETAREWGIEDEYLKVAERESWPFGLGHFLRAAKPQDPELGPPLPKVVRKFW